MKKRLLFSILCLCGQIALAQVNNPGQVVKDDASNHANNDVSNGVDDGLNKTEGAIKGLFSKKKKNNAAPAAATANDNRTSMAAANAAGTSGGPTTLKTYSNYDFVPGDKILFEDRFVDDQDGEFPAHWILNKGQAIVNKVNGGDQAFFLTEGNYVRVAPRVKSGNSYLPQDFTIEFDFFPTDGSSNPILLFNTAADESRNIDFGKSVGTGYFPNDFSADYPGDRDNFAGQWHHAAMVKKGNQIKCYLDQFRVLVIPDCESCAVTNVEVGGIGDTQNPIVFKNFRIAAGGGMNMIGKKFTDTKIVTHGINFDIDKANIRPESMGTLNMIVQVLKDNPDIKFEIDGHTDNSGAAAHNQTLSQQRADAVKAELVILGVDPSRLSTKGFGDTRPIADNGSPEGQANNRRVEFVKI